MKIDHYGLHQVYIHSEEKNLSLVSLLDGHIFLESFSSVYKHAHDFLIAIAEVCFVFYFANENSILIFIACLSSGIYS